MLDPQALREFSDSIAWLPDPGPWRYLADPFAVQRSGVTHVFVEAYDYRTKHGTIERHDLGPDLRWLSKQVVLTRPFHLSYPFLIEQDGEVFMVPESHKAGEIALYRARSFPDDWVRETAMLTNISGAEPSLIYHDRLWWMFFTVVGKGGRDQRELHIAFADQLTGPWQLHPKNPVLVDRSGARPGGTPFIGAEGLIYLPVQDCSLTYGGKLRFLRFHGLTESEVDCEHLPFCLAGDLVAPDHADGLHTFSRCGNVTLIDVKRISRSYERYAVDMRRRLLSLFGRKSLL